MDKASASGAGDSRFESWAGHLPFATTLRTIEKRVAPINEGYIHYPLLLRGTRQLFTLVAYWLHNPNACHVWIRNREQHLFTSLSAQPHLRTLVLNT